MRLIWGFSLAFFSGLALFAGIWFNDSRESNQLWATLIVIIYGFYVSFIHRREPGAADSIYYLGFIFTLLALCFSMLPAAIYDLETLANDSFLGAKVLSSFSVAFTTTLVGLVFRVFLVQIVEIGQSDLSLNKAADQVSSAAEKVAMEISLTAQGLERSRGEITASLASTSKSLEEASAKFLDSHSSNISALEKFSSKHVENTNNTLLESQELYAKSLENSLSQFNDRLESSSLRYTQTATSAEELTGKMRDAILSIQETVAAAEKTIIVSGDSIAGGAKQVLSEISSAATASVVSTNGAVSSSLKDQEAAVEKLSQFLSNKLSLLSRQIDGLNLNLEERTAESLERIVNTHLEGLQKIESGANAAATHVVDNLASQLTRLEKELPSIEPLAITISEITDSLRDCGARVSQISSAYASQTTEIERATEGFKTLSSAVSSLSKLSEVTISSTEQLNVLRTDLQKQLAEVTEVNGRLNQLVVNTAESVVTALDREMRKN